MTCFLIDVSEPGEKQIPFGDDNQEGKAMAQANLQDTMLVQLICASAAQSVRYPVALGVDRDGGWWVALP
jgi:hypothetical protein